MWAIDEVMAKSVMIEAAFRRPAAAGALQKCARDRPFFAWTRRA
jgi:hypothetical protein